MKQRIKLTESQLHRVIKESVKDVLKDIFSKEPSERDKILDRYYRQKGRKLKNKEDKSSKKNVDEI